MSALTIERPASGAVPPAGLGAAPPRRKRAGAVAMAALTFLVLTPLAHARGVPDGFADLASKVTPAVVNISTERAPSATERPQANTQPQVPEDSPLYDMFRRFQERQGRNQGQDREQRRSERMRALGSGFIIDPAGYVVTNNHVIDGANKITVTLTDGRQFAAKLIGRDTKTDLALLKIDGDGKLPTLEFATKEQAGRVGDWVMAVGNPFGLGGTVTVGIISARNRDLRSGPYDDYLQVDAAINHGNSGGPLFDMDGRVQGINTAIYSPNGGSVGIGFAISASVAAPVIAQLREHGKVDRGWIGVRVQSVTDDLAKALGLKKAEGALVAQVEPKSPAAGAGLKSGDVILSVGDQRVASFRDLARLVAGLRNGETAKIGIMRDGKELTLEAKITGQPQEAAARPAKEDSTNKASYGIGLATLSDEERQAFGVPDGVEGVLIARVQEGSPAAEKGLQAGDVIVRIGQDRVTDPAKAIEALNRAKSAQKPVVLLISRKGETMFVAVQAQA
jgi:serine protease Do